MAATGCYCSLCATSGFAEGLCQVCAGEMGAERDAALARAEQAEAQVAALAAKCEARGKALAAIDGAGFLMKDAAGRFSWDQGKTWHRDATAALAAAIRCDPALLRDDPPEVSPDADAGK